MIRTKIIATMGPSVNDPAKLLALFNAGCDVCRLNFSHGTLDEHLQTLRNIREAAIRYDFPIAVLGDLCGPKIRLGKVKDQGGTGGMPIAVGETLTIQREPILGENGRVSSIYKGLIDDVAVNDPVLVEDGMVRFVCIEKGPDEIRLTCTTGGVLKTSKGINLPRTHVNLPSITPRDWECADWAIDNDLDYLALSFVRRADELIELRAHLRERRSTIHLISKIEMAEALNHIDPILAASDGLMIARGDLGVEMDVAQVPIIQKDLVRRSRLASKPVIVATQMLQTMIDSPVPTRAEVSDVANAIFDGTDAVMLSGETSIGKFPTETVSTMAHVAKETEAYLDTQPDPVGAAYRGPDKPDLRLSAAIARGVRQIVQDVKPKAVFVYSRTGMTARIFSKHRFPVPIVALSHDHRALRRMALHYGVMPVELNAPRDLRELVARIDELVLDLKLGDAGDRIAKVGDRIVVVAGASLGTPGAMNGIVLHTIGEVPVDEIDNPLGLRTPPGEGEE